MDREIIDLYDRYTHEPLPRREFLTRLSKLAGSAAAAAACLSLLEGRVRGDEIDPDDERIVTERVTWPVEGGEWQGYLARPKGEGPWPAVVVVHENRGLNAHIEDVARRLAVEGFIALAPDALSLSGGTPADEDAAREGIRALDPQAARTGFVAAAVYLRSRADTVKKVGCVGFCWGGAMCNRLAIFAGLIDAAVVYYGRVLPAEEVPSLAAPLLLHHAGNDDRVNAGLPGYEEALKEHGKKYTLHLYEGAEHAFNNDTREARYHPEAAALAWERTLAFFREQLRGE